MPLLTSGRKMNSALFADKFEGFDDEMNVNGIRTRLMIRKATHVLLILCSFQEVMQNRL
jgi:hypothetical protein